MAKCPGLATAPRSGRGRSVEYVKRRNDREQVMSDLGYLIGYLWLHASPRPLKVPDNVFER